MKDLTKPYTNGEITIVCKPTKCIHSIKCFTGLPEVFDPRVRPWIRMENSTTDAMIVLVARCLSGASSIEKPAESPVAGENS